MHDVSNYHSAQTHTAKPYTLRLIAYAMACMCRMAIRKLSGMKVFPGPALTTTAHKTYRVAFPFSSLQVSKYLWHARAHTHTRTLCICIHSHGHAIAPTARCTEINAIESTGICHRGRIFSYLRQGMHSTSPSLAKRYTQIADACHR